MKAYENWKFTILFVWLVMNVVVSPLMGTSLVGRFAFNLSNTFFFVAAILSMTHYHLQRLVAFLLGILCIVGKWFDLVMTWQRGIPFEIADRVLMTLFLVFTIITCIGAIFKKQSVTHDSLLGSFSGYIMLGIAWGFIHSIIELLIPGSFHVPDFLLGDWNDGGLDQRDRILTYFSFCTLITVGYGDITPVSAMARSVSIVEAISGQIYMAVLVAILVAVRVSQGMADMVRDQRDSA